MKSSLYLQYLKEKQQYPGMSTANIAKTLNVSEAALAHARVGQDAQRLQVDALTLLTKLENIGLVKSTTANRYAIQQMIGRYKSGHPPRPLASPAAMRKGRGFHTPYTLRPFTL
ncbi:HmuS [Candidatus Regiella insecticola 5.15]|uniref:HmuS n=1 Tax=Candidatus Regiella insecticola 5.15 TaxID=1005043 RepID=G2H1G3_9ENTR|nr:ChuX/HutX family heme-like substrate-binding protein [Candidatus Regiella insecticola]EGY28171.1 HmuS [Candidatus Regiella insecticola 5.15]